MEQINDPAFQFRAIIMYGRRENIPADLGLYTLETVIYGVASSPCMADRLFEGVLLETWKHVAD